MKKVKIAPSILSADFGELNRQVSLAKGADIIHVDVMDGHYVPNITIGPAVIRCIKTKKPLDVHLMITDPDRYIDEFAKAGASAIIVHPETCADVRKTLKRIRKLGCRAGAALNPGMPLCYLYELMDEVDVAVIMSVRPGFGGQKFMKSVLPKIKKLRKLMPFLDIAVDGGVNKSNMKSAVRAGANILVMGSSIYGRKDIPKAVKDAKLCVEYCA